MQFSELGLSPELLQAVADAGYTEPTPIQAKAIPEVLANHDIVGIAQTGTGKTASFTLPMIDRLAKGRAKARMPRSLILEPTRELAAQVAENFEIYGKHHKLNMALLIGGVSFEEQAKRIDRGVDVLIATPGRLLDHFERGKLMLVGVDILVIDEADRMLDMGFIPDVERICSLIPGKHQTMLFSATMPAEIRKLAEQFQNSPTRIEVAPPSSPAKTVSQLLAFTTERSKRQKLRELLNDTDVTNALVFCNRKRDVDTLYDSLKRNDFSVAALHGDMDQYQRMNVLEKFKSGEVKILVASDVAARGLDIPKVSHVFNFDVPMAAEDYIHRIGRTGRAGRSGVAITIATKGDDRYVDAIEKLIGVEIPRQAKGSNEAARNEETRQETAEPGEKGESEKPETRSKSAKTKKSAKRKSAKKDGDAGADETRQAKPKAKKAAKGRSKKGGNGSADKDKTVGMGDHVPAFMLRPVRLPKRSGADADGGTD